MYFSDPSQTAAEQRRALSTLRALGVTKVEISFSGGNDSGGADGMTALDKDGKTVEIPQGGAYRGNSYKNGAWVQEPWQVWEDGKQRPATAEEIKWSEIGSVLEAPIYDRWGSFAGEFDVHGTLTWDVVAGTHEIHGQESVYQDFSY